MSETGYVYTLSDPRTGEPCYVGATVDPQERYEQHTARPHSDDLASWVQELAEQDMKPEMNLVQIDDVDGLADAERRVLERVASEHEVLNSEMSPSYSKGRSPVGEIDENGRVTLNDTDREILAVLSETAVHPAWLADELNISRQYATTRLRRLREHGHVDRPEKGFYLLADDPRDN